MTTNILCNEDLARASDAARTEDAQTPFGDTAVANLSLLCKYWPVHYSLPPDYYSPVTSAIPTLALSGYLDPVTPPAWGELTVANLSRATHVVAKQAGHIVGLHGCGPKIIRAFLNQPTAPVTHTECLNAQPGVNFMRSANAH